MTERRCLHCGMAAVSKRSSVDHRRFFKVISIAFYIWPETCRFQPDNPEHLRAYLIAHTTHRTLKRVELPADIPNGEFLDRLREFVYDASGADGHTKFGIWQKNIFQVAEPLSIDWDTVSQKQFNEIRDQVYGMILDVTGVDSETLLIEYGRLDHAILTAPKPGHAAPSA